MYRRTQPGTTMVAILLVGIGVVGAVGISSGGHPVTLVVGGILVVCLVLFRSLTIEIDAEELRCFFGDGLIRRRFRLVEIASATAVRNRWWYGWGIRLTPHGWMFNVSGLDAVQLELASGKSFRIGTDRPAEVVEAIGRLRSGGGR